jgi:hypothetical protein
MATYDDLSLHVRLFLKNYPFRRYAIDPTPCARLAKPLEESRVALETRLLVESHRSYAFDHEAIRSDVNLAFPLDRFRELKSRGVIGALNHRHFSFMGSIVGPRRLIDETAPQVARMLAEDRVDVAFLTPV